MKALNFTKILLAFQRNIFNFGQFVLIDPCNLWSNGRSKTILRIGFLHKMIPCRVFQGLGYFVIRMVTTLSRSTWPWCYFLVKWLWDRSIQCIPIRDCTCTNISPEIATNCISVSSCLNHFCASFLCEIRFIWCREWCINDFAWFWSVLWYCTVIECVF